MKVFHGITASSYAFHVKGVSNPGSYRSAAWGVNDTCAAWTEAQAEENLEPWNRWYSKNSDKPGEINRAWSELSAVDKRRLGQLRVNTYAETSPFTEIAEAYPAQVGVDRITVRP